MKVFFYSILLLFVSACNGPCIHSFTKVMDIAQNNTITLDNMNIALNGYVRFVNDTSCRFNQLVISSKQYNWIKSGTCYNISATDMHSLLIDALPQSHAVVMAVYSNNAINYYSFSGYIIKKNIAWFIVDKDGKKLKMNEKELFKKSVVLLIHKDAARNVLDKIIK